MERGSTIILRTVIILIGLVVLLLCLFALPHLIIAEMAGDFDYGYIFVGMYLPVLPFFVALYQGWKFLNNIDKENAFSVQSVSALKTIKYCALIVCGMYTAGMPYVFYVADRDDAPGVAALGFVIIFASFIIATAAAVFQRLVQKAVDIKSENDLTV